MIDNKSDESRRKCDRIADAGDGYIQLPALKQLTGEECLKRKRS
jgi:hypothetical protein